MNFYRRFPGDYARDTKHLTLVEHGAYTLLLDYYYATEKPIPSLEFALSLCGARRAEERRAVKKILRDFFRQTTHGYKNKRGEEELKHLAAKRESAKNSAKVRWGRSERNANASETHYEDRTTKEGERTALQTLDSRRQTPDSQDHVIGAAVERGKLAAAAFTDLGFDKPFGQSSFQAVWVTHYMAAVETGNWITQSMEDTIQECQKAGIGIPPQFYEAKHDVEKREIASTKKVPL